MREKLTEAETSLATTRSDLQRAQAGLEAAGQKQAALKAALHEAQVAQRSEAALRHRLESSTAWRITWPIRRALTSFLGFRRTLRRHVEHGISEERDHGRIVTPKRDGAPEVVTTTHDAPPTLPQLLSKRFRELDPLRVFNVPGDAPRVSLVTDSISAGSLFGGVGTALVIVGSARPPSRRAAASDHADGAAGTGQRGWPCSPRIGSPGPATSSSSTWGLGARRRCRSAITSCSSRPPGGVRVACSRSLIPDGLSTSCRKTSACSMPGAMTGCVAWRHCRIPTSGSSSTAVLLFDHLTQGPDALPNILAHGVWFEPAVPGL